MPDDENRESAIVGSVEATVPTIADETLLALAAQAEKRMEAVRKIRKYALTITSVNDWVDENGKPYLQASGAEKIARVFGVSWRIGEAKRENLEDGHFSYEYTGEFSVGGAKIMAVGKRNSRDGFFKRYKKERGPDNERVELPPSELNADNVQKSAFTNLLANGITRLLGIRNLTWEELESVGIKRASVGKVEYNKQAESADATALREKIRGAVKEMVDGDDAKAKAMLEELTSFVPRGKTESDRVPGKQTVKDLTDKQLPSAWGRVKDTYEAWIVKCKPCDKRSGCMLTQSLRKECQGPFSKGSES